MKTINLRKFYGSVYKTDTFIELPDEIADALESEERIEHYSGQKIREHTYSIDYSPEIEYHFPNQEPSAEEILLAKRAERSDGFYAAMPARSACDPDPNAKTTIRSAFCSGNEISRNCR